MIWYEYLIMFSVILIAFIPFLFIIIRKKHGKKLLPCDCSSSCSSNCLNCKNKCNDFVKEYQNIHRK